MATLSEIMVSLSLDMKDFNRQMSEVGNKTKKIGSQFSSVGSALSTKVTAPIALMGAGVIKAGAEFEATMSKVQAVTNASGSDMGKLSDKAQDLGKTTKFQCVTGCGRYGFLRTSRF
ncbi:phage tail tape measure protein [Priestia megaterium]